MSQFCYWYWSTWWIECRPPYNTFRRSGRTRPWTCRINGHQIYRCVDGFDDSPRDRKPTQMAWGANTWAGRLRRARKGDFSLERRPIR